MIRPHQVSFSRIAGDPDLPLTIFVSESPAPGYGWYEAKLSSAERREISASPTPRSVRFTTCDNVRRSAIEAASLIIAVEPD
jgi:hypothetical protein